MAYGTPTDPVGGTVITVAYAVSNLLDPIRWLRGMTGGSDPPGSNYVVRSTSTTATSWSKVTTDTIDDLAISTAKVAALAITDAKISAVDGSKLVDGTIPSGKLGASSVIGSNIADGNIDLGVKGINSSLTGAKVANNTLDLGNVALAGSLTNAKIADNVIDLGVKGLNASLTGAKVANATLDLGNLAIDGSLTPAKLAAGIAKIASGTYSGTGSTSGTQITTGFVVKYLFLESTVGHTTYQATTTSGALRSPTGSSPGWVTDVHLHASNGFVVGDGGTRGNDVGDSYSWTAFG